jgi:hypothetical protein
MQCTSQQATCLALCTRHCALQAASTSFDCCSDTAVSKHILKNNNPKPFSAMTSIDELFQVCLFLDTACNRAII